MFTFRKCLTAIGIAIVSALLPSLGWACACCADPGQRWTSTQAMDGYIAGIFDAQRFGPVANVFISPCDIDCVEGIDTPDYAYNLTVEKRDEGLNFTLVGAENSTRGSMLLRLPKMLETFATDMAPDPNARTTVLYKEWRMKVSVAGDGTFSKLSGAGAKAELVLIGGGNSCDSEGDFTHWMLDVAGNDIDFRLFGAMAP